MFTVSLVGGGGEGGVFGGCLFLYSGGFCLVLLWGVGQVGGRVVGVRVCFLAGFGFSKIAANVLTEFFFLFSPLVVWGVLVFPDVEYFTLGFVWFWRGLPPSSNFMNFLFSDISTFSLLFAGFVGFPPSSSVTSPLCLAGLTSFFSVFLFLTPLLIFL